MKKLKKSRTPDVLANLSRFSPEKKRIQKDQNDSLIRSKKNKIRKLSQRQSSFKRLFLPKFMQDESDAGVRRSEKISKRNIQKMTKIKKRRKKSEREIQILKFKAAQDAD
jgi:hypothetical protein